MFDIGLRLGLCAGLAAALGGALLAFGHHERNVGRAEVRAEWAADTAARQSAVIADQVTTAAETKRRIGAIQEIAHGTTAKLTIARADAAGANAAGSRLRDQQSAYLAAVRASSPASDPGAATGGPTAADAVDLLSDLFSESDDGAGILAAALDRAHASGLACERAYDSLMHPD